MPDVLAGFIAEAMASMTRLDEAVLALERSPTDAAAAALIFRLVHTLKGGSGFLGLHRLERLANAVEDLLEASRETGRGAAPPLRAGLFAAAGAMRAILAVLASCGSEPPGDDDALIASLARLAAGYAATPCPAPAEAAEAPMRPVGDAWKRLHRLAEALALELGKPIELVTEGGDTMIHRSTFEELGAALMHLVRNSADHGLEMPSERRALGKRAAGTIRLTAMAAGERAVLTVADDGRGLPLERIRARVVADGLAAARDAAAMSDEALTAFIFRPGFSSASRVTRTSGRGVGLDVTRTWVESIGGAITVASVPGSGASFRLVFPRGGRERRRARPRHHPGDGGPANAEPGVRARKRATLR
ncbi:MAG: Hpt domain-containing protein [Acetobacteraceae bacterium]|nr:Hpt domain-containing protein [Acetobacteraceae bacterium]